MDITTKATDIELTPEITEYLEKRLGALDKFINPEDTSVLCEVEVGRTTRHHQQGDIFRAEINLHIAGKELRAESSKENLFDAIDEAQKEMVREIKRHRNKQRQLVRKGAAQVKSWLHRARRR